MPRRLKGTKKKNKKCFLCGSTNDLTRDHIPPKNLFKPPLPTNLIKEGLRGDHRISWNARVGMRKEHYDEPLAKLPV